MTANSTGRAAQQAQDRALQNSRSSLPSHYRPYSELWGRRASIAISLSRAQFPPPRKRAVVVVVAAAEEERFRRIKHWAGFPAEAIRYCLAEAGIGLADVEHVAVNSDPSANVLRRVGYVVRQRPELKLILDRVRNQSKRSSVEEELAAACPGKPFRGSVVAKTDPPMLSIVAAPVARIRGATLVNWLQDVFPEVAQSLGFLQGRISGLAYPLLRDLRDRSLKRSAMNVALGERMAGKLVDLGVPAERICIIPNFANGRHITPLAHATNPLRNMWGLSDSFVVAYSGNLGRAHEYKALLDAIERLERHERLKPAAADDAAAAHRMPQQIVWLFVGGGAAYEDLQRETSRRGSTSVRFEPYQPRERLAESLSAADVQIVSLRPQLEGLMVPSKFYGIAAAGRPTIFVGDGDGEIPRLLTRYRCGLIVPAGDGAALSRAILDFAGDPQTCKAMGARAREAFEQRFDLSVSVDMWKKLLVDLASAGE